MKKRPVDPNRRKFLVGSAALASAGAVAAGAQHEHHQMGGMENMPAETPPAPAAKRGRSAQPVAARFVPVEAPDLPKMPFTIERGVKVFRIRAEVVKREFLPGRVVNVWGFNGSMPGP